MFPLFNLIDADVFVSESSASGLRDTVNVSRDQGRIISRASTQQKQDKQQKERKQTTETEITVRVSGLVMFMSAAQFIVIIIGFVQLSNLCAHAVPLKNKSKESHYN